MSELRVVSLIPSATEITAKLGLENVLVGRSHECDFPESVQDLPICSMPRYEAVGDSAEIDRNVKKVLEDALSIYEVNTELIKELRPTHIITQSQCEVCAISTAELTGALREYIGQNDVKLIDLNPKDFGHVIADMQRIADALGYSEQGMFLKANVESGLQQLGTKPESQSAVRLAQIEWIEPLMTAKHWMPELFRTMNLKDIFSDRTDSKITFEDLQAADPEVILIAPCGYNIEQSLQDLHYLEDKSGWEALQAVRNSRVYIADGNQFFNRPGPRLLESARILGEVCFPDAFTPDMQGKAWLAYG